MVNEKQKYFALWVHSWEYVPAGTFLRSCDKVSACKSKWDHRSKWNENLLVSIMSILTSFGKTAAVEMRIWSNDRHQMSVYIKYHWFEIQHAHLTFLLWFFVILSAWYFGTHSPIGTRLWHGSTVSFCGSWQQCGLCCWQGEDVMPLLQYINIHSPKIWANFYVLEKSRENEWLEHVSSQWTSGLQAWMFS